MPLIQLSEEKRRWSQRLCIASLAAMSLTACGGGSGGDDNTDANASSESQEDQTAPQVSLVNPANNATDVTSTTIPSVTFNEDMLSTSIDGTAFSIESDDSPVDITVTFDGEINQANLQPNFGLGLLRTYTATITQQVADLVGNTLEAEYSWSFTTGDGSWQTPVSISGNADTIYSPQVSVNAQGQKVAIWLTRNNRVGDLWASIYDVNTGWSQPERVDDADGNSGSANIVLTADGNALAVWHQTDENYYTIWSNRYDAETGWQEPNPIATTYEENASAPEIALDSQGNAVATWHQRYEDRYRVAAARYDSESGWGEALLIDNDTTEHAYGPKIGMDQNGNAILVWYGFDGTRHNIYSNRYDIDNGWTDPITINVPNNNANHPHVTVNDEGEAMAVWYQADSTNTSRTMVWTARYSPETGWSASEIISSNTDDNGVDTPKIALDNQGNALAIWTQNDGVRRDIWSSYFQANNGWQAPNLLENLNTGSAYGPTLSMDSNGNAMAMWVYDNDGIEEIMAARYRLDQGWQEASNIDSDELGSSKQPQVTINPQGVATAVWAQSDTKIWTAQFE